MIFLLQFTIYWHFCINAHRSPSVSIFPPSVLIWPGETCSTLWSGRRSSILWPITRAGRGTEQGWWSTAASGLAFSTLKPWWTSLTRPPGSMCLKRRSVSSGMTLSSPGKRTSYTFWFVLRMFSVAQGHCILNDRRSYVCAVCEPMQNCSNSLVKSATFLNFNNSRVIEWYIKSFISCFSWHFESYKANRPNEF